MGADVDIVRETDKRADTKNREMDGLSERETDRIIPV